MASIPIGGRSPVNSTAPIALQHPYKHDQASVPKLEDLRSMLGRHNKTHILQRRIPSGDPKGLSSLVTKRTSTNGRNHLPYLNFRNNPIQASRRTVRVLPPHTLVLPLPLLSPLTYPRKGSSDARMSHCPLTFALCPLRTPSRNKPTRLNRTSIPATGSLKSSASGPSAPSRSSTWFYSRFGSVPWDAPNPSSPEPDPSDPARERHAQNAERHQDHARGLGNDLRRWPELRVPGLKVAGWKSNVLGSFESSAPISLKVPSIDTIKSASNATW